MKKFAFPLDRVMDWRRAQARIEQTKLERLFGELGIIDAKQAALQQQLTESENALRAGREAAGFELAALDTYRRFAFAEHSRLLQQRAECRKRISAQMQVIVAKRRDVRLLELVREQRLKIWQAAMAREIDQQAGETFLAKWNRP